MAYNKSKNLLTLSSLLLSAICLFLLYVSNIQGNITVANLLNMSAAITTGMAFLVGCYFALLAVTAYSHFRDIEKVKSHVTDISSNAGRTVASLNKKSEDMILTGKDHLSTMSSMIDESISIQLSIGCMGKSNKHVKKQLQKKNISLRRMRSLLALKYDYFEKQRRINLIRELFEFATLIDLPTLKKASLANSDNSEIKEIVDAIIVKVKEPNEQEITMVYS